MPGSAPHGLRASGSSSAVFRESKDRHRKFRTRPISRAIIDYEDLVNWIILDPEIGQAPPNRPPAIVARDRSANAGVLALIHFLPNEAGELA